jgi:decaprenylphospho-beta-D-erythro-pentofuranosid-2-ulose 2-reductase
VKKTLIIGATSAIAEEWARLAAARGDALFLVARSEAKLKTIIADLQIRGAHTIGYTLADLSDCSSAEEIISAALDFLGSIDVVLIAHGSLSLQEQCQQDYQAAERELRVNFLSVVALLTPLANIFERQGHGSIAVISSVAGDRGRQSNYVYGTAKAAVSAFLEGLRNRLHPAGVQVLTIKPGFVDTPMTAHLEKGALFASPAKVAQGIDRALRRRRNVVYLPWFWHPIMCILRHVPECIFKRLKL